MATLFISDLHLDEAYPETAEKFLKFLETDAKKAEALYILGDFFEAWAGDDDLTPFNLKIIKTLKEYTDSGIPTYIIRGNRDFLLGKRFSQATGIKYLKDPSVINLYGTSVLLMHGDLLCTKDKFHQRFRKLSHNRILQFLFLGLLPLKIRKAIANELRKKSKERHKKLDKIMADVDQKAIENYMMHFNTQYLIHGHIHRLKIHEFELDNKLYTRTVLGSWHDQLNTLICEHTKAGFRLAFDLKSI